MKRGDRVLLSDVSIEDAKTNGVKRIFLADVGGLWPIVAVYGHDKNKYPDGKYDNVRWKYAVPIPTKKKRFLDPVKMMQFIVDHEGKPSSFGGWEITATKYDDEFVPQMWNRCGCDIPDEIDTTRVFHFDNYTWHPGMVEEYEE